MARKNRLTRRFTIGGVIFGLVITFFITQSTLDIQNLPLTYKNLKILHNYPIFYIIDLLPIILGLFARFCGRFFEGKIEVLTEQIQTFNQRNANLQAFSEEILKGNTDAAFDITTLTDNLGKTLIELRDEIKNDKLSEEIRKKEDFERNWVAEGLARFGEIMRRNNDNIEALSFEIISNICKYVGSVQGGFYILENDDRHDVHFELTAHFAYDRQKYNNKRIEWNEGLIGRSAFEKRTIVLDEIPEDYVEITSGLGETNPRYILITPLKTNEEVHGVIEIAGFEPYLKHHVDFIEKIAENIGSTIGNVKINIRTAKLLAESQEQAERLAQQEEEMRQNMEELQATQEEAAKQGEHFVSFTNSVNHTLIRAEYDINGILIYANTKFLKKLDYTTNSEVEGHHISMFLSEKDREWFNEIWTKLARGGRHFEGYMKHITKKGKDLWTMATYTPVRNAHGEVEKVLFLAIDTTEQKEKSLEYEGQIKALNMSNMKIDFMVSGKLVDCNERFQSSLGFTLSEMKQKSVFEFFNEDDQANIEEIWNNVINGIPYEGQIRVFSKLGQEIWLQATFVAKNDMYGEIDRIIAIANNITDQKELEIQIQKQNKKLLAQEEKLKNSEIELSKKLEKAKKELRQHFIEIEKVKVRNELTLEGALDAIMTFNQKGIVEFFNNSAETLWDVNKKMIIGRNVRGLFNESVMKDNDFVNRLVDPEKEKLIGVRTEITITTKSGENKSVLCLLSDAVVDDEHSYTAFIQNIELELF
ncbi:MAG: PAS domain S-box protein [Salinivirgaceae bacterium]|nr:PAS domain S-box protein [Salinivirgaceae bacterium]MDD4747538.1 PAS domain S-box protein [Salinivirgaceae bacterium]MDY0280030.1 PAS domain S-box protein [Salinivirgaceae bacterium]